MVFEAQLINMEYMEIESPNQYLVLFWFHLRMYTQKSIIFISKLVKKRGFQFLPEREESTVRLRMTFLYRQKYLYQAFWEKFETDFVESKSWVTMFQSKLGLRQNKIRVKKISTKYKVKSKYWWHKS